MLICGENMLLKLGIFYTLNQQEVVVFVSFEYWQIKYQRFSIKLIFIVIIIS